MELTGKLLVALPVLVDPNFDRTVVLLLSHGDEGAVGVVLNRPSTTELAEPLPRWSSVAAEPAGRVRRWTGAAGAWRSRSATTATAWRPIDLDGDPALLHGPRACACSPATPAGRPASSRTSSLEGAWVVCDSEPDDAFRADADDLWHARRSPAGAQARAAPRRSILNDRSLAARSAANAGTAVGCTLAATQPHRQRPVSTSPARARRARPRSSTTSSAYAVPGRSGAMANATPTTSPRGFDERGARVARREVARRGSAPRDASRGGRRGRARRACDLVADQERRHLERPAAGVTEHGAAVAGVGVGDRQRRRVEAGRRRGSARSRSESKCTTVAATRRPSWREQRRSRPRRRRRARW